MWLVYALMVLVKAIYKRRFTKPVCKALLICLLASVGFAFLTILFMLFVYNWLIFVLANLAIPELWWVSAYPTPVIMGIWVLGCIVLTIYGLIRVELSLKRHKVAEELGEEATLGASVGCARIGCVKIGGRKIS